MNELALFNDLFDGFEDDYMLPSFRILRLTLKKARTLTPLKWICREKPTKM